MMLAGKKVVVVGGSSGIGLATAELAKKQGADVIIASRNAAKLDAIANKPYLIDVDIAADVNPAGAGVWELPGLGQSKAGIGTRYQPA